MCLTKTISMNSLRKIARSFQKYSHSGFTLIELLVVIGILGVLAAALVATIDPFEQLKKANDANVKNTAVEFINANIRYYTTHSAMPWSIGTSACNAGTNPTGALWPTYSSCLNLLITDGEIKAAFTSVTGVLSSITINGNAQAVTACFQPQSRAQRNDPNAKFNYDGTPGPSSCPNATATNCYWCSQ